MNIYALYKLPSLCQSSVIGSDSLYCGKWGKLLKAFEERERDRQKEGERERERERETLTSTL